jgi:hypothetical protein
MVLLADHLIVVLQHMTSVTEDTVPMKMVSSFQFQQAYKHEISCSYY